MSQHYYTPSITPDNMQLEQYLSTTNPEARWKHIKHFVCHFLKKYRDTDYILDAAAGIGTEYHHLISEGFWMHMNEPSSHMISLAKKYYAKYSPLQYESTNKPLSQLHPATIYGGILLLRNTLQAVPTSLQQTVINNLYNILKDNGTLIIDEIPDASHPSISHMLKTAGFHVKTYSDYSITSKIQKNNTIVYTAQKTTKSRLRRLFHI